MINVVYPKFALVLLFMIDNQHALTIRTTDRREPNLFSHCIPMLDELDGAQMRMEPARRRQAGDPR